MAFINAGGRVDVNQIADDHGRTGQVVRKDELGDHVEHQTKSASPDSLFPR